MVLSLDINDWDAGATPETLAALTHRKLNSENENAFLGTESQ